MNKVITTLLIAVILIGGLTVCRADEDPTVNIGDERSAVIAVLGTPGGHLKIGNREILTYDRGRVELEDDIVVGKNLVSSEEGQRRRIARELAQRERIKAQRRHRIAMREEGLRVLDEKLTDPFFLNLPARMRMTYWADFKKRYPDVDASVAYAAAQADHWEERKQERLERKVDELERRTEVAEARASKAEQRSNYYRPVVYYRSPYHVSHVQTIGAGQVIHKHPNTTFVIGGSPTTIKQYPHFGISSGCKCATPCGKIQCPSLHLSPHGVNASFVSDNFNVQLSHPW